MTARKSDTPFEKCTIITKIKVTVDKINKRLGKDEKRIVTAK